MVAHRDGGQAGRRGRCNLIGSVGLAGEIALEHLASSAGRAATAGRRQRPVGHQVVGPTRRDGVERMPEDANIVRLEVLQEGRREGLGRGAAVGREVVPLGGNHRVGGGGVAVLRVPRRAWVRGGEGIWVDAVHELPGGVRERRQPLKPTVSVQTLGDDDVRRPGGAHRVDQLLFADRRVTEVGLRAGPTACPLAPAGGAIGDRRLVVQLEHDVLVRHEGRCQHVPGGHALGGG